MLKNILIAVAILAIIIVAATIYFNYRNRTLSPPGEIALTNAGLTVSVKYSRPFVRGRNIFGTAETRALQPYGRYWRLGANDATTIIFSEDVVFNNNLVKKGPYWIYAIPGAEMFTIGLNTEVGKWGAYEPDFAEDVLRTTVPVSTTEELVEQFTIFMEPLANGVNVIFEWEHVRFEIPVEKAQTD